MSAATKRAMTTWALYRAEALSRNLRFNEALELVLVVRAVEPDHEHAENLLLRHAGELVKVFGLFMQNSLRRSILGKYNVCVNRGRDAWRHLSAEEMRWRKLSLTDEEIEAFISLSRLWGKARIGNLGLLGITIVGLIVWVISLSLSGFWLGQEWLAAAMLAACLALFMGWVRAVWRLWRASITEEELLAWSSTEVTTRAPPPR